jgi:hypothetical protein
MAKNLGGKPVTNKEIKEFKDTNHFPGKIYSKSEINILWTRKESEDSKNFPNRIWQERKNGLTALECAIDRKRNDYNEEREERISKGQNPGIFSYPTVKYLKAHKLIGFLTGYAPEDPDKIPYFKRSLREAYIQLGVLDKNSDSYDYWAELTDLSFPEGDRKKPKSNIKKSEEQLQRNILRDINLLSILDAGEEDITESNLMASGLSGVANCRSYGMIWAKRNLIPWHEVKCKTGEKKWSQEKIIETAISIAQEHGYIDTKLLTNNYSSFKSVLPFYNMSINSVRAHPDVAKHLKP